MKLVVVESPTKARTLSRFLGEDYIVEATTGHIKDLPKSKLGVDIENNFEPQYDFVLKRKKTIESLKARAKGADVIYLATDPDREGEAIASHVADLLKKPKLKRIVFHEITKEALKEALKAPREVDVNLVDAQTARRVLDRLVGYKLSPLLWRKVRRGLSAGRVQSVALRLIVEREREIKAFKAQEYWEIYVEVFKAPKGNFLVKLLKFNGKGFEITNEKEAKILVNNLEKSNYQVLDVKKREVVKASYPPFTTSTMTQAAARIFGWSAKRTMQVAQKLYEEGLITYHRTDSMFMAASAVARARDLIGKNFGEKYLPEKPRFFKTKSKVAQEAHEAIRPTNVETLVEKLEIPGENKKLYLLIWNRFIACQMAPSVYDETVIDVSAKKKEGEEYLLRASGQTMKFDGWRKLFAQETSQTTDEMILPEVEKGEELKLLKVDPQQKFTMPPARYNEASLIKTLEKLGIGRPSTYAPIITTIQIRQYVSKEEGKFFATPIGFAVNDFLIEHFPETFDYAFTAKMEDELDSVANGKIPWVKTIKDFWKPFDRKLVAVGKNSKRVKIETEKLGRECPECKEGELVIRIGRFGKFISCSRFPDCKYTEKYLEKTGAKCPECKEGDVIIKKTRRGKRFFGCSRYPDCKWASWRNQVVGVKSKSAQEELNAKRETI
ncbi:type I DNA topoisomerase [Candidatus Woesebacteria bacterium]|nr:type I DNA topoisomerase [Candidatus Woesebacteria bacterium]